MPRPEALLRTAIIVFLVARPVCWAAADEPYEWPLKVNRVLTGSFAEFRTDHFHAGLDLSTGGRTGLPVAAPADGYVWRIRVSPFGYGRSIYLKLHDGRFVVYAHLEGFCEPATERVKAMQRQMESYEVDIYLRPEDIPIKRGQIVGFSGRSASKGWPLGRVLYSPSSRSRSSRLSNVQCDERCLPPSGYGSPVRSSGLLRCTCQAGPSRRVSFECPGCPLVRRRGEPRGC